LPANRLRCAKGSPPDTLRVDIDPDAAGAVFLGCGDDDPSVAIDVGEE
jgi:hypothetical protein